MRTVASAKTKLILFGEHSAVYGYPAIGLSLPWEVTVSITPAEQMQWKIDELDSKHKSKLDELINVIPKIFPELSVSSPIEINIESDAPIGIGVGSSAALCVALTKCLISHLNLEKRKYRPEEEKRHTIWQYAHKLEKIFHDTPSGIDTGISTFENLCYFERKNGMDLPICVQMGPTKLSLIVGALPRQEDTRTLVSSLRKQKESNPEVEKQIALLGRLSSSAINFLSIPNPKKEKKIGLLASEVQKILNNLSFSNPELDSMIQQGITSGATGGKLSGAGGGGCYFLIAESPSQGKEIAQELTQFAEENKIEHVLSPVSINF
jgi:mevalonate kinase